MVNFAEFGSNIAIGASVAFSLEGLLYCFLGVFLGTFIGVLPGVGAFAAISVLLPLTFSLDPTTAIIMLAGIYYGSVYGGSTASILLNLPGTASTAVTCLDGYPMSRQGRAGVALFITTIASFIGSVVGLAVLAGFAPILSNFATDFASPEYFMLMVMGLIAAAILSSGSPWRAVVAVSFGLIMGIVGVDISTGDYRFTFGILELFEGLPLVAMALGLFGLPEIINNVNKERPKFNPKDITFGSMFPTRGEWKRTGKAMARGTGVGSFFGALPGTGGVLASFMSYALEKRIHRDPSIFGKGAIEGISGPETANNSAIMTAFIPTLTLGIPGDALMALMLGVFLIHGVTPGPEFIVQKPEMFWGLVVSFLIGNVILLGLNVPLIGLWVRILAIPYSILFPSVVGFICIGVYAFNFATLDIFVAMVGGLLGYLMLLYRFDVAPMILGLILGPLMESNLKRSLLISRGDFSVFIDRPISGAISYVCFALLAYMVFREIRGWRKRRAEQRVARRSEGT